MIDFFIPLDTGTDACVHWQVNPLAIALLLQWDASTKALAVILGFGIKGDK